jgi:hypothetical protein
MSRTERTWAVTALLAALIALAGCRPIFPPASAPASRVNLRSAHEARYVVAEGAQDGWALRQSPELDERGWFTLYDLGRDPQGNRRVALKTWTGRFVTAPMTGSARQDRMLWQELRPGDCAEFTVLEQPDGKVALKTCAGKYLTAGDDGAGWEPPLAWALVGETSELKEWERFTLSDRR